MIVAVKNKAEQEGMIQVFPIGCVTKGRKGKDLIYMEPLVKAGVVGFSDDGDPVRTPELMEEALEIGKMFNLPVIDHCEDPNGGPPEGEEKIAARDLEVAEKTNGWVHIARQHRGDGRTHPAGKKERRQSNRRSHPAPPAADVRYDRKTGFVGESESAA
jgi:dihydroorotase